MKSCNNSSNRRMNFELMDDTLDFFDSSTIRNGKLYPIEFKKAATVKKDDMKSFSKLSIFQQPVGMGAVVSLYPDVQLIRENVRAIPAWRL